MQKAQTKKKARRAWTEDEVKLLKKLLTKGRAREIAERIGRPLTAVRQKAYHMGIRTRECRPWSASEIRRLKRLYPSENVQSIADKLGRSYRSVAAKAHKLGLTEELRVWSKRELNLLKRLYPSKTAEQIAEQIGRSVQATRMRIVLLGLRKRFGYEECHRVVNGAKEKLCGKCRKWKGESQFYKCRSSKDGLQWTCKDCESKYVRKHYEQIKKAGREYLRYEDRHRVVKGIKQKLCSKCKRWKNESDFYKNRATKDGLDSRCKKCSYKPTGKSRKHPRAECQSARRGVRIR